MPPVSADIEELAREVDRHADHVLLLLTSIDGVLADYQPDPAQARVPSARMDLLKRLQTLPDVVVAVISGRALEDVRQRVPLGAGAFVIALHGLDIVGPDFRLTSTEAIGTYRQRMEEVVARVQDAVAHVPGVRLECKGPVVALHTRDVASGDVVWSRFQLLSAAADLVNSAAVRALRGQDVLELLPNVGDSRADAVRAVERCVTDRYQRPVFTVYIGADWPDDDAAKMTGEGHVAAVVGRRHPAGYHLDSARELDSFLEQLIIRRGG